VDKTHANSQKVARTEGLYRVSSKFVKVTNGIRKGLYRPLKSTELNQITFVGKKLVCVYHTELELNRSRSLGSLSSGRTYMTKLMCGFRFFFLILVHLETGYDVNNPAVAQYRKFRQGLLTPISLQMLSLYGQLKMT